jgi:hypothetical protein
MQHMPIAASAVKLIPSFRNIAPVLLGKIVDEPMRLAAADRGTTPEPQTASALAAGNST